MKFNIKLVLLFLFIFSVKVKAQNDLQKSNKIKLGFNFGFGSQQIFPFNSKDYSYDVQFYKAQLNYLIVQKTKWDFEVNLEPGYYQAEHQLLNKYYVRLDWGDDYLDKKRGIYQEEADQRICFKCWYYCQI